MSGQVSNQQPFDPQSKVLPTEHIVVEYFCFCFCLKNVYKLFILDENSFCHALLKYLIDTPGRWQSKTPILSRNVDQKPIETVF